jgi:hypothetical protein
LASRDGALMAEHGKLDVLFVGSPSWPEQLEKSTDKKEVTGQNISEIWAGAQQRCSEADSSACTLQAVNRHGAPANPSIERNPTERSQRPTLHKASASTPT